MKLKLIIILFLLSNNCFSQLKSNINSTLIRRIDSLKLEDQKWRNLLTDFENGVNINNLSKEFISENISKTDSLNYFELEKVIQKNGYPTISRFGSTSSHNFWLMVQHQDNHIDFQEKVLLLMKEALLKHEVSGKDFAYLTDRVLVNKGEKQMYGTQMTLNKEQTSYEPKSLFDPEKVNERRMSVGLGPIELYIQTMNNRYFGTLKK